MYKVLVDSDKYLLSYSALINPLEQHVHHMTSQILSILIDFFQTSVPFFDNFSHLQTFISLERENIFKVYNFYKTSPIPATQNVANRGRDNTNHKNKLVMMDTFPWQ